MPFPLARAAAFVRTLPLRVGGAERARTPGELEQIKQTISGETKEINDRISGLDERLRKLEGTAIVAGGDGRGT
jgi:hypothetical protein